MVVDSPASPDIPILIAVKNLIVIMEEASFENRINLTALKTSIEAVRSEIGKILVGQEEMVNLLLTAIFSNGHVLIEGVPGIAKTLTAKLLAKTISADFSRIQFTPDLMPSDIIGTAVFNVKESKFEFRRGPVFGNIILIDEINRAPAKTQAALFESMEERQVTVDGQTYILERPYLVVATQNPIEQEGTYRLPEAQLDRFLFKVVVNYPSLDDEISIIARHHERKGKQDIDAIIPVLNASNLTEYQELIHQVHIDSNLVSYIAKIVRETREHPSFFLGASPRASVALLNSSKAFAAINGRDFVTPEDIKYLAVPVLRHRVALSPEREMEGISADDVLKQLLESVEVPR